MVPSAPPGLVVSGGQSSTRQLASIETFGFEKCRIPPLPESRYGLGSFLTPSEPPQLAVCGGWWMGKPNSSDCLTLNVASGQWGRGTFTNALLGDDVQGVITMEGEGVFVVHKTGISILPTGSKSWVAGPFFTTPAVCACNISNKEFVTFHFNDEDNVHQYSVKGFQPERKELWPRLLTKRQSPGCGATPYHLVIAGGVSDWDEILNSVEIFHIATRALRKGRNLRQARAFFQIIPIGTTYPRLLAIGGKNEMTTLDTTEWWEEEENSWQEGPGLPEENSWQEGPGLPTGRANFAALTATPDLVCVVTDVPLAHSCPANGENDQKCTFSNAQQGNGNSKYQIIKVFSI